MIGTFNERVYQINGLSSKPSIERFLFLMMIE